MANTQLQLSRLTKGGVSACVSGKSRGRSLPVWMDITGTFPPSLNSVFILPVAGKWRMVVPGLYCPCCSKAREKNGLVLKLHQSPREDGGPALSPSQSVTVVGHLRSPASAPLEPRRLLQSGAEMSLPRVGTEEPQPLLYLRP